VKFEADLGNRLENIKRNSRHFKCFTFLTYYWEHFGSLEACSSLPTPVSVFGDVTTSAALGLSRREQGRVPCFKPCFVLWTSQTAESFVKDFGVTQPRVQGGERHVQPDSVSERSHFWLLRAFALLSVLCWESVYIAVTFIICIFLYACILYILQAVLFNPWQVSLFQASHQCIVCRNVDA